MIVLGCTTVKRVILKDQEVFYATETPIRSTASVIYRGRCCDIDNERFRAAVLSGDIVVSIDRDGDLYAV